MTPAWTRPRAIPKSANLEPVLHVDRGLSALSIQIAAIPIVRQPRRGLTCKVRQYMGHDAPARADHENVWARAKEHK